MNIVIRPKYRESIYKANSKDAKMIAGQLQGPTKMPTGTFTFQIRDNAKTKRLNINLDRLVDNPYFSESKTDANLPSEWSNSEIWKQKKITRQQELEIRFNKPPGFLDTSSFGQPSAGMHKQQRTYLQTFMYQLKDGATELNLDNLNDIILYEAALVDKMFGTSYLDAQSKPDARFYIHHQDEDESAIATSKIKKSKMFANLTDLDENYPDGIFHVAVVLGLVKGKQSKVSSYERLYDFLDKVDKHTVNNTVLSTQEEKFSAFSRMYDEYTSTNADNRRKFMGRYHLQQMLNTMVVSNYQDKYIWEEKRGTNLEVLGKNYNSALQFLLDPQNEEYYEEMKAKMETRL